ncbi:unnamed protein product [Arctia plantaginis]|uniref:Fork-head domain-containing protein n=1 Tax=Arctia plantaginis TaxID=874455 RepID=A0A8S1A4K2_ARCPL|nr:unnamed protein product [Arctia plantaginis]
MTLHSLLYFCSADLNISNINFNVQYGGGILVSLKVTVDLCTWILKSACYNSIRHNLSLHNRFMRVQNEGTGKSSWWMINPDAKPGKSVRRRAASMETSKFEKRRGRVKKKAELPRNGVTADATPSPSSSVSESLDMFPDSPMHSILQLSPDFRQRASSNASSCGRLSPIPSLIKTESDWASDYIPAGDYTNDYSQTDFGQEELAGSLADSMKLAGTDPFLSTYVPTTSSSGGSYRYGGYACPRHPPGGCACATIYTHPAHPAHPTHPHSLDLFRPPPPADPADIMQTADTNQTQMVTTSDAALMNGGMMVQTGAMGPTTVMGQLMGALNTGLAEDLNIETLDHGFDCNVDEVIKHELSMEGTLDFNFPQQHSAGGMAAEAESQFAAPAPPVPTTLSGGGAPRTPYSAAPSWGNPDCLGPGGGVDDRRHWTGFTDYKQWASELCYRLQSACSHSNQLLVFKTNPSPKQVERYVCNDSSQSRTKSEDQFNHGD